MGEVFTFYEWVPRGGKGHVDPLRYGVEPAVARPGTRDELAWLKLRFKRPGQSESELIELPA